MGETKVKAIVVGGKDYKEKDMIVNLFTLEYGMVSVLFRGVKSANAKLKSAKELFSFGDFIYSNSNTKVVISADIIDTFYDLTKDIKKYYTACAIIDVLKTVLPDGETNPELFINTLKSFKLLAVDGVNIYNVLNKYLIQIFEGVGYKFELEVCNNCGAKFKNHRYINLEYGDITCFNCRIGNCIELSPSVYGALRILTKTEQDKLSTIKILEETNKNLLKILLLNFEQRFNKKISIYF